VWYINDILEMLVKSDKNGGLDVINFFFGINPLVSKKRVPDNLKFVREVTKIWAKLFLLPANKFKFFRTIRHRGILLTT
jgi:hypothetical protein